MLYAQLAQRLCAILGLDGSPENASALSHPITLAQLRRVKPVIEALARQHKNETAEAVQLLQQLAQVAPAAEVRALGHFICGNVSLFQEQPLLALAHYEQAEQLYRQQNNLLEIARMAVGRVSAYRENSDYARAIAVGNWALTVLAQSPHPDDQRAWANLNNAIAVVYEHIGYYVEAIKGYECKRAWWQNQVGGLPDAEMQVARSLQNLGVARTKLGQYVEAMQTFAEAKRVFLQAQSGLYADDLLRTEMNMAWLEVLRGSHAQVIQQRFAEARQRRQWLGISDDDAKFVLLDLDEANWTLHQPNTPISPNTLAQLKKIRAHCDHAGMDWEKWYADLLIGQVYLQQQKLDQAQALFAASAYAALEANDDVMSYLAHRLLAKTLHAQNNWDLAQQILEQTIERVEHTRGQLNVDAYRAGYLDDKLIAYQDLQALLIQRGQLQTAFNVCERAKARTLADMLQQADRGAANVSNQPSHADAFSVRIKQLQANLPDDTLAIAYSIVHGQVYAYVVCANLPMQAPILLGQLPTLDSIQTALAEIASISTLAKEKQLRWLKAKLRAAQQPLAEWHGLLIRPILAWLEAHALAVPSKWVISPDDYLHLLPFSAFFDPQSQRYLIEEVEIVHIPSFSTWQLLGSAQMSPTPSPTAMIVGLSAQGMLPRATQEAQAIGAHFGQSLLLLENEATHQAITAAMPNATLLYFATHGVYRSDVPSQSYLELIDARLTAGDILQMRLHASCVVLSACETGIGTLSGNELMGLIRAFLYAGTKSVLATHWVADDEATALLMVDWAKHVRAGCSFSHALQLAKTALINQHRNQDATNMLFCHPFYWGAISYTGIFGKLVR
ncbi:MAG: CHAT domain-containing protein [Anaerolineae bacterium]|nr:CHAT domain-containing protein [Anaerolineae bacterium]